jgi:lantibiotic leader peptide-processing serine protease
MLAGALVIALSVPAAAQPGEREFVLPARGNDLPHGLQRQVEEAGGTVEQTLPQIGVALVSSDEVGFQERAAGIRGVRSVVPDVELQWIDPEFQRVSAEVGDPPASGASDPFFDLQWGHDAIDAPQAWQTGERGAGARVAVLDSGIDRDHPDLAGNLNRELSESFVPGEEYFVAPGVYFNHGTHVAGTVAAEENGVGVIGVAPEAEIVAVKVLSERTGSGSFAGVAQGIVYAADIDSDIINMSLGGVIPSRGGYCDDAGNCVSAREVSELVNLMKRATNYAHQQGTTVIASAGNSSFDRDGDGSRTVLPTDLPNVLSISATGPNGWALDPDTDLDLPAFYTNYGRSAIDFAAPGGNVDFDLRESGRVCTVAGVTEQCWRFDLVYSTIAGGWGWAAGTSMAAPHASGVAALIIGQNGGSMSPAQVAAELRRSADRLSGTGNDPYYGKGRVNANDAVR